MIRSVISCNLEFDPEAEGPGVMVDVVPHEGGDKAEEVVEVRRHPQHDGVAHTGGHCGELLCPQLLSHVVCTALVYQDLGLGTCVGLDQLCGVVLFAGLHGAQVAVECLVNGNATC